MKKLISISAMAAFVLSLAPASFAATATSGPLTMSASVSGTLSLSAVIYKNSTAGAVIPTMDFGQLMDIGTGTLRSSPTSTTGTGAADVLITANSHGLPYTISQTGTAMSNGTTSLPAGALTVVPVYAAADNGGATLPTGAALGTKGTWVASGKTLYTSETGTAAMRTIQAVYSITDDPTAGATASVPINQAGGTYTGTVTITVTA